jgi:hypothetical protein
MPVLSVSATNTSLAPPKTLPLIPPCGHGNEILIERPQPPTCVSGLSTSRVAEGAAALNGRDHEASDEVAGSLSRPGPHSVLKRPTIGVKAQTPGASYASVKQRVCRQFVAGPLPHLLLAMQKVEGSTPARQECERPARLPRLKGVPALLRRLSYESLNRACSDTSRRRNRASSRKPASAGSSGVAGAGFEPATFGL